MALTKRERDKHLVKAEALLVQVVDALRDGKLSIKERRQLVVSVVKFSISFLVDVLD